MNGYGIRAYGRAFLELIGFGDKALQQRADKVNELVRRAFEIATPTNNQPLTVLVPSIIARCREEHEGCWALAASAQLRQIRGISLDNARAIVAEFCTDSLV